VDVLVVGAGPAGMSAGIAAAEQGKRVLLLDQGLRPGGQIWRHRDTVTLPAAARAMLERAKTAGVIIASGARVVDAVSPKELIVDFRGHLDRQHTGALIVATGAKERFLPFPGWTLPGVVGVGGLQALLKSGLSLSGARVVIAGTGPLLLPVAAAIARAGAELLLVAEQAPWRALAAFGAGLASKPGALWQAAAYRWAFRSAPFRTSSWVTTAEGYGRLRRVIVQERGRSTGIECDWLATGAGLVPSTELAQVLGCALDADAIRVDALQATTIAGVWAAGECTGIKGDEAAIAEGAIAGHAAAGAESRARGGGVQRRRNAGRAFAARLATTFAPRAELLQLAQADTIICRCEDVRYGDINPSWTQRQAKLWTRVGMGECQGAVCGPACAALLGWQQNAARPPIGAPMCGEWGEQLGETRDERRETRDEGRVDALSGAPTSDVHSRLSSLPHSSLASAAAAALANFCNRTASASPSASMSCSSSAAQARRTVPSSNRDRGVG
jgi:NADPH-dependent 2,4-dienoyl-CoA reductase/sulfur reductase-like enzyme